MIHLPSTGRVGHPAAAELDQGTQQAQPLRCGTHRPGRQPAPRTRQGPGQARRGHHPGPGRGGQGPPHRAPPATHPCCPRWAQATRRCGQRHPGQRQARPGRGQRPHGQQHEGQQPRRSLGHLGVGEQQCQGVLMRAESGRVIRRSARVALAEPATTVVAHGSSAVIARPGKVGKTRKSRLLRASGPASGGHPWAARDGGDPTRLGLGLVRRPGLAAPSLRRSSGPGSFSVVTACQTASLWV